MAVAVFGLGAAGGGEPLTWVLSSMAPEGSPSAAVLDEVARTLERAAVGRVRVRARHGGALGDEASTLELCQKGRIQMWAGSTGAASASVPALSVLDAPYLFEDLAAFQRIAGRDVLGGPRMTAHLREHGLAHLGMGFIGWRALSTTRKAIRRPEDLRGLALRIQPSPLHRAMWRPLGVRLVEVALPQVVEAFRDQRVEATDLPALYIFAASLADQIHHFTPTRHVLQSAVLFVNRRAFDELPASAQRTLLKHRTELVTKATRVGEMLDDELVQALAAKGVAVVALTPGEKEAFRRALAPAHAEALAIGGPAGTEILEAIGR